MAEAVAMRRVWAPMQPSPKSLLVEDGNHRFLALLGNDADLHLALLDVEHRIGSIALRIDNVPVAVAGRATAIAGVGEKDLGSNGARCSSLIIGLLCREMGMKPRISTLAQCPAEIYERVVDSTVGQKSPRATPRE